MRDLIAAIHPYLLLATGTANLILIGLALLAKPYDKTKFLFCYFTTGIAGYLFLYGLMALTNDPVLAMRFSTTGQLFINQISPALYCFSVVSLGYKRQIIPALLSPLCGLAIVFLLRTVEHQTVVHYWWGFFNVYAGKDMPLKLGFYFAFYFGFAIASFFNFSRALKKETNPTRRTQLILFIVALSIAYIASWDHLPIMGVDAYPFGYIPITLFSFIVFYAITQHQFLDIKIAIKRLSLILLIYGFLILVSLPAAFPILNSLLNHSHLNPTMVVLTISIIIGTIFSFGPLIYAYFVRNTYWLKSQVTTGLTHELKSPLNAIQGALSILQDEIGQTPETNLRTAGYLDMIQKNTARLESYVQNLLQLARIQDEAVEINKSPVDLSHLVHEICESNRSLADTRHIELRLEITPGIQIDADKLKMTQVVSNLLSNALKFSEGGNIHVQLLKEGKNIRFSAKDTGVGLSKNELKKIFDRFYQANPNAKGSGIGLTIAKAWVEAHGGKIWAESEGEGMGTTVSFTLPIS